MHVMLLPLPHVYITVDLISTLLYTCLTVVSSCQQNAKCLQMLMLHADQAALKQYTVGEIHSQQCELICTVQLVHVLHDVQGD